MQNGAILIVLALVVVTIGGCSRSEAENKAGPAVKPPVAVEAAAAEFSGLTDSIAVTGTLEPKFSVEIKTQISGLVKQVLVSEWVRVKKGQSLARIDTAETEALVRRAEAGVSSAKAALAQAQVAAARAEREMARIVKLKESGLATQQTLDDTGSELEAAKARMEAARGQVDVSKEDVRQTRARMDKGLVVSPIDGVVGLRNVNVGDLASDASEAKSIFRIVDNRLLNLTVTVPSVNSARIKVGQPLKFTVDSMPDKIFTGKVMFINPELSPTDRSLKVIAEVRNPQEVLKGGLFAKGHIVTGTRSAVLQIPRSAVTEFDLAAGKGNLFVVESGLAHKREIRTVTVSGEMIEVASGLKEGEQYVVRGGFNLKNGDRVVVAAVGK